MDDTGRLAAELGCLLDELPIEDRPSGRSTTSDGRKPARRERLERYIAAMSPARRLRLAGALHLLSRRLDEDLAHPDSRLPPRTT